MIIVFYLILGIGGLLSPSRAMAEGDAPLEDVPAVSPLPTLKTIPRAATDTAKPKKESLPEMSSETRLVLRAVAEKSKKNKIWEATFVQDVHSTGLGSGSTSHGHFTFSSPNLFRYSITDPEASDFISDGHEAWQVFYRQGRDKAAYVRHFANLSQVELDRYLLVLRGIGALSPKKEAELNRDFQIEGKANGAELNLSLSPKKSTEIAKVTLIFQQDQDMLKKAILVDALGNETHIVITTSHKLRQADPSLFKPDYPKDSQVENL